MKGEPNKHYAAHAGKIFVQDVVLVQVNPDDKPVYYGRSEMIPKGSTNVNNIVFHSVTNGYDTPKGAFLGTHKMLNTISGLGEYFHGGDPFEDKRK